MKNNYSTLLLCICLIWVGCGKNEALDDAAEREAIEQFMIKASSNDLFKIETGNKATKNGGSQDVLAFGYYVVTDYSKSNEELKSLASQKQLKLPETVSAEKLAIVNRIAAKSGKAFDQDFTNIQITAHNEAIQLFQDANKEIKNTEIKAFIARNLSVLQDHLKEAQRLNVVANQ